MRHILVWTLVQLGLPSFAAADGLTNPAAEGIPPGSQPGIESPETPPPGLDLHLDPTQLPSSENPLTDPHTIEAARPDRYTGADQPSPDRGLSFGVEVKPRSQVGNLARKDQAEDPSLQDRIENVIERPAFGLRGRYRF